MSLVSLRRAGQRGDTIVEVLIAMAIISLVLAAAYVTSNRNANLIESSQERQQGQRLVQAQIENLRNVGGITASGKCFDATGVEQTAGTPACLRTGVSNSGAQYKLSIAGPPGLNNPTGVYTVNATWSSLGGNKTDDSSVTMYYRLN